MNIIDMPLEIFLIANGVLPKPTLPQGIFAISMAGNGCV